MTEHENKDLSWHLLRDHAARIGLIVGAGSGLLYAVTKADNETALFFQRMVLELAEGAGEGAIIGAGLGYCVGLAPEFLYRAMKKYKIFERVSDPIYRAIVGRRD